MLEIKILTYKYENHIALNNINLKKLKRAKKIAILGNNGSGKTTFSFSVAMVFTKLKMQLVSMEIMSLKLLEEM